MFFYTHTFYSVTNGSYLVKKTNTATKLSIERQNYEFTNVPQLQTYNCQLFFFKLVGTSSVFQSNGRRLADNKFFLRFQHQLIADGLNFVIG